jgi:transcription antitermination factor NusG
VWRSGGPKIWTSAATRVEAHNAGPQGKPVPSQFAVEVAKLYPLNCQKGQMAQEMNGELAERIAQPPQFFSADQGTLPPPLLESHWCAAYVIARHEKVVADHMARRSVESFLPLYHSVRNWKNRRAHVELPLFPSYVFIRISVAERIRVLEVPGVVHIVSFRGTPVAVPDEQIEALRIALQLRRSEPYPYPAPGGRIRIKAGPLQGLEGVVVRHNSRTRIIVSIDFIQRSTSVELWPEDVESLPDTASEIQK